MHVDFVCEHTNSTQSTEQARWTSEPNERHKNMGATEMAKKNKTIAKQNIFYGE